MSNANDHKKFTSSGDIEAEMLLAKVLSEMKETLSGTGLSVFLGGSYGRGDGGVRLDRENGILYNDLDFFVFARKKNTGAGNCLREIAEKYEHELKVDVDFSRIMTVKDIKNNASRLMMQELKRGYHPVCGEDLLEKYLPELPAEKLPFSEACRLLLNRGMGLLLAGEKISGNSPETDFILRNLYKAILGTGDAMLISSGKYRWQLSERLELFENSDFPDIWKTLYREAVDFKRSPHRVQKPDMLNFWNTVRDFYRSGMLRCAGTDRVDALPEKLAAQCRKSNEVSLGNCIKYCLKTRSLPLKDLNKHTLPAVTAVLPELYNELEKIPETPVGQRKIYQYWLIFN